MLMIFILDLVFNKDRGNAPKKFIKAVGKGMRSMISVAAACACAGIILGVISLTGIGTKFSSFMISASNGNTILALLMTMLAALILGCGLPTTAAYIVLSSLAVPALTRMGVPLLSAHLFVFYFGSISTITPPVALSSYAAAALAGTNPNKVGWQALKLGLVAFIIPYMFVYQPALLMQGTVGSIILVCISGMIGVYFLSVGIQGWFRIDCTAIERILAFCGGILMIYPELLTDIIGLIAITSVVVSQLLRIKKKNVNGTVLSKLLENGAKDE